MLESRRQRQRGVSLYQGDKIIDDGIHANWHERFALPTWGDRRPDQAVRADTQMSPESCRRNASAVQSPRPLSLRSCRARRLRFRISGPSDEDLAHGARRDRYGRRAGLGLGHRAAPRRGRVPCHALGPCVRQIRRDRFRIHSRIDPRIDVSDYRQVEQRCRDGESHRSGRHPHQQRRHQWAGGPGFGVSAAAWDRVLAVDLTSVFYCSRVRFPACARVDTDV
jgi:hypothetical protein